MITFRDTAKELRPEQVEGLFQHWGTPPATSAILAIFQGSGLVQLALDDSTDLVVGYVTAITDGVSCAYLPHLEVRPEYQGQGLGSELVRQMRGRLQHLYMIDLICDDNLIPFYERLGFRAWNGMILRNYSQQSCEQEPLSSNV